MTVPGARVELLQTLTSKRLDGFGLPEEAWRLAAKVSARFAPGAPALFLPVSYGQPPVQESGTRGHGADSVLYPPPPDDGQELFHGSLPISRQTNPSPSWASRERFISLLTV